MKKQKTVFPKVKRVYAACLCVAVVVFFFASLFIAYAIMIEAFSEMLYYLGADESFSDPMRCASIFSAGVVGLCVFLPACLSDSFQGVHSGCVKMIDDATCPDPALSVCSNVKTLGDYTFLFYEDGDIITVRTSDFLSSQDYFLNFPKEDVSRDFGIR